METRSKERFHGIDRTPQRSWLKGAGIIDEEIEQPLIAVVNSWEEIAPENIHLDKVSEAVKAGIEKLAIVMPAVEKVKPSTNKIAEALAHKHGELLKTFPLRGFYSREEARQWVWS